VALANEKHSAADIATQLNAEGYRPAKQVEQFGPQGVLGLLRKIGYTRAQPPNPSRLGLEADEWWLPDLARALDIPMVTLYGWWRRGWVNGRYHGQGSRRCVLWADEKQVVRLRYLHQQPVALKIRHWWLADVDKLSKPTHHNRKEEHL
jgi:hypothetical protein